MEKYTLLFQREEDLDHSIGSTMVEPYLLITPIFMSLLLIQVLPPFIPWIRENHWTEILFEFPLLVLPLLLTVTIAADFFIVVVVALAMLSIVFSILLMRKRLQLRTLQKRNCRMDFLTNGRAALYLMTVVCILAVDFNIFPERLHKATTYGFGLMDVGVGSFVLHSGLVSKEARIPYSTKWSKLRWKDFVNSLKTASILLVIGFARLLVTHLTNYSVAVEEYGKQWNFFFTLAVVQVICNAIVLFFPLNACGLVSVAILLVHQIFLLDSDFVYWLVEDEHRNSFVEDNKEGIFSTPGYVAIYLIGLQGGRFLFSERQTEDDWVRLVSVLGITTGLLLPGTMFASIFIQPTSRRMANLAYCSWIVWYNVTFLFCFLLCELFLKFLSRSSETKGKLKTVPFLLEAVNQNGLVFFLVANVLTGCVNLSIKTHSVETSGALVILSVYMMLSLGLVIVMKFKKIRVK